MAHEIAPGLITDAIADPLIPDTGNGERGRSAGLAAMGSRYCQELISGRHAF
jgi:hypothetical protein